MTAPMPWTTTPDGRNPRPVHGNYVPWNRKGGIEPYTSPMPGGRPTAGIESDARPIPGSGRLVATAGPHHGHSFGSLVVLDPTVRDDDRLASVLAVAVADKPAGPFTFVGQRNTAEEHGWGQDLGLFKDQDGRGYLVYDDGHRNIRIDLLADDFLASSDKTTIALTSDGRGKRHEGAALIRHRGKYIAAGSGVRGWNPTETSYAVADAPLGPYREVGLMSEQRTWNSLLSNFVHIAESDRVFAMCDQWFRGPAGQRAPIDKSCQLWLPVSFDPKTETAKMLHVDQWGPWK